MLVIQLDRPDALNALTRELLAGIADAVERARGDDSVRAVVLTGAGRSFCVGQDLAETQADGIPADERLRTAYRPAILGLRGLEKPVIAAINGACAGAGLSLALACDVRLAAERARFIPAFADIGLVPDGGATYFLPRLVGVDRAFAWLASGEHLDAAGARDLGLVAEVLDGDALLPRAIELGQALAAKPGVGVGLTKRLLGASLDATLEQQFEAEAELQGFATSTPAYKAAEAAFLERGRG